METITEREIYIECFAQTDVGRVRTGNEDNYLVTDLSTAAHWTATNSNQLTEEKFSVNQAGCLLSVADGMGGALAGEVASQMTVDLVRELMRKIVTGHLPLPYSERLRVAIEQTNLLVNEASDNNVAYTGMGSTITAAVIDGDTAYLAQVGDSRCYLIRDHKIHLLTKDQSLVWQMVMSGYITEEEAESHSIRNVILQAIGSQPQVQVVVDRLQLCRDDILLFCSDGLSGKVKKQEMLEVIESANSLKQAGNRLIILANDRGGEDNITLVITKFDGSGLTPAQSEQLVDLATIERNPLLPYGIDDAQLAATRELPSDAIEEDISETTVPMTFADSEADPTSQGFSGSDNAPLPIGAQSWWRRVFINFGRRVKEIFTNSGRIVLRL